MVSNDDPVEALMRRTTKQQDGCWNRSGANSAGYPTIKIKGTQYRAARLSYELFKGPIPPGLTVDHLCRNIACVNPDHLEAVTLAENSRREREALKPTHCPVGHAYDDENSHFAPDGRLNCRACWTARNARQREYRREWKRRKRAQASG